MQQAQQISILRELFRQLDSGVNVDAGEQYRQPTDVYTRKDLAQREWQALFRGHPQVIGLSDDLPEPGSYLSVDDFGVPVLATRGDDGRLRAFVNACRHRGAQVAQEARGHAARFTCPFHAWTYSNAGELLRIPRAADFGPLDHGGNGLLELPAAEAMGLLWVHPDPAGVLDPQSLLGPLSEELAGWDLAQMRRQGESTIDMQLNWKLANDTFGETYHFSRLHRDTLGQLMYGDVLAYEELGRNHRFVIATRSIDLLREQPEQQWQLLEGALLVYYLFPNIQLTLSRLGANLVRIYPDGENPGRSITRISFYLNPAVCEALANAPAAAVDAANTYDARARQGTNLISAEATMEVFRSTIEREDYAMGEAAQRSCESGHLQQMIFGRNEPALHHFHRCFRDALGMDPLPLVATEKSARAAVA